MGEGKMPHEQRSSPQYYLQEKKSVSHLNIQLQRNNLGKNGVLLKQKSLQMLKTPM
jgi:hypothetical protein